VFPVHTLLSAPSRRPMPGPLPLGVAPAVDLRVAVGVAVDGNPHINPRQSLSPHVTARIPVWPGAATDLHGLPQGEVNPYA
jgi:hypothetical protein